MSTYIRKRKNGGYSECTSPVELVGKGRCCHTTQEGEGEIQVSKIQRGMYEIIINENKLTIKAQKEVIIEFFNKMPKIDSEKQKKIIEFLQND